jgi:hypothetical protein
MHETPGIVPTPWPAAKQPRCADRANQFLTLRRNCRGSLRRSNAFYTSDCGAIHDIADRPVLTSNLPWVYRRPRVKPCQATCGTTRTLSGVCEYTIPAESNVSVIESDWSPPPWSANETSSHSSSQTGTGPSDPVSTYPGMGQITHGCHAVIASSPDHLTRNRNPRSFRASITVCQYAFDSVMSPNGGFLRHPS